MLPFGEQETRLTSLLLLCIQINIKWNHLTVKCSHKTLEIWEQTFMPSCNRGLNMKANKYTNEIIFGLVFPTSAHRGPISRKTNPLWKLDSIQRQPTEQEANTGFPHQIPDPSSSLWDPGQPLRRQTAAHTVSLTGQGRGQQHLPGRQPYSSVLMGSTAASA